MRKHFISRNIFPETTKFLSRKLRSDQHVWFAQTTIQPASRGRHLVGSVESGDRTELDSR